MHVVGVHVIEVDGGAVVTTVVVNDHSHEEGLMEVLRKELVGEQPAMMERMICLLIDQINGVLK